jgi:indolepyruvate ferredoxin oxidoreductase
LLAKRDPRTGHLIKRAYGPWMLKAFGAMAPLRFLRGTALDPFGRTEERRAERALIGEYEALVAELLTKLSAETLPAAVALASLPDKIRGYGHVKERAMREVAAERAKLLEQLRAPKLAMAAE